MKILRMAVLAIAIATSFTACSKDHDEVIQTNQSIQGVYSGKLGFGNGAPNDDFKFAVKDNGVFQEISTYSGNVTGEGTYTITGNTIKATYNMLWSPYNQYSVSGTFNSSNGKITGTWGFDENFSDGGKIDMTKQ